MSGIYPEQVLRALGLRTADGAVAPTGGMSGSTLLPASTADDEQVVVKVTDLDADMARDQALRELTVYTQVAPEHALPTPRLIVHHRAAQWVAIALARHEPAPPAPEWSADDWAAFARMLGSVHRTVHPVPNALLTNDLAPAVPRQGLKAFAERLWHGPGDGERISTVLNGRCLPGLAGAGGGIEAPTVRACQTAGMLFSKIALEGRLTVIAGPRPPSDDGFCSDRLQVLHWRIDEPFADDGTHLHRASDEVYVVLEGAIDLDIDGSPITVGAGEAVTVGAGVSHALVAVRYPARGLTIRGPAIDDKVVTGRERL